MAVKFWKEYNFDENRTTCTKCSVATIDPLPRYSYIPLAVSLNPTSSFHVNLLLKSCTEIFIFDTTLWLLKIILPTKGLGVYFILACKCKSMKIQLPFFLWDNSPRYNLYSRAPLGNRLRLGHFESSH